MTFKLTIRNIRQSGVLDQVIVYPPANCVHDIQLTIRNIRQSGVLDQVIVYPPANCVHDIQLTIRNLRPPGVLDRPPANWMFNKVQKMSSEHNVAECTIRTTMDAFQVAESDSTMYCNHVWLITCPR